MPVQSKSAIDLMHAAIFDNMPVGLRGYFLNENSLVQKAKPYFTVLGGVAAAYLAVKGTIWLGKTVVTYGLAVPLQLGADLKKSGDWAVITGADDGFGKEYAFQLAEKGLNLVLIARRLDKTEAVAEELRNKYGIQTKVISLDIGQMGPDDVQQLRTDLQNLDIGLLVNSAGINSGHGKFLVTGSDQDVSNVVNLNARGSMLMCRTVMPLMLANKKKGQQRYIINVGAHLGITPVAAPGVAVYSATKAFLHSFSIALDHEYADEGISVQSYLPGATDTKMGPKKTYMVSLPSEAIAASLAHVGLRSVTNGHWKHAVMAWVHSWKKVNEMYIPHP